MTGKPEITTTGKPSLGEEGIVDENRRLHLRRHCWCNGDVTTAIRDQCAAWETPQAAGIVSGLPTMREQRDALAFLRSDAVERESRTLG
jgi:hypothetical protein